jgi:hypothetical protein
VIETGGFRGLTVIHGSRKYQVGEGDFLIGNRIGYSILGHNESRPLS